MNTIKDVGCYVNGDGSVIKDYIFVEDLINVIIEAAKVPLAAGNTYQVGSGVPLNINDIVSTLDSISNKFFGRRLKIYNREKRLGDVSYECNIEKVKSELLFSPTYDIESGLKETFKWFLENCGGRKWD